VLPPLTLQKLTRMGSASIKYSLPTSWPIALLHFSKNGHFTTDSNLDSADTESPSLRLHLTWAWAIWPEMPRAHIG